MEKNLYFEMIREITQHGDQNINRLDKHVTQLKEDKDFPNWYILHTTIAKLTFYLAQVEILDRLRMEN